AYTLGEAYDDLVGGGGGLDLAKIPTVERWIEAQAIDHAALIEARRRRIDQEPEVQRRVRQRLDNYLLDGYYQRQIIHRIQLGPDDLRLAYEQHRDAFVRLRSARVVSVSIADSAAAAAFAGRAANAPSLKEAAGTAALAAKVSEENPTFPAESPLWTQFENHIAAMSPGQVAGPFRTPDGWLIFQVMDKRQ